MAQLEFLLIVAAHLTPSPHSLEAFDQYVAPQLPVSVIYIISVHLQNLDDTRTVSSKWQGRCSSVCTVCSDQEQLCIPLSAAIAYQHLLSNLLFPLVSSFSGTRLHSPCWNQLTKSSCATRCHSPIYEQTDIWQQRLRRLSYTRPHDQSQNCPRRTMALAMTRRRPHAGPPLLLDEVTTVAVTVQACHVYLLRYGVKSWMFLVPVQDWRPHPLCNWVIPHLRHSIHGRCVTL
jgi:hypothetical protein